MREIKIRDAGEGDIEALANLMTQLGYPTSIEDMRQLATMAVHRPPSRFIPVHLAISDGLPLLFTLLPECFKDVGFG